MVSHAGPGKTAPGLQKAVYSPTWFFMPLIVECTKFWIELQMGVGQVIMNPPGQGAPVSTQAKSVSKPRYDNAGCRTFTLSILQTPDMVGRVTPHATPTQFPIAKFRHTGRPVP